MSNSPPVKYSPHNANNNQFMCLICYNNFEKNVSRPLNVSQKVFNNCSKQLHEVITKTLKKWDPKSQKQPQFCQPCFDTAYELSKMTEQLEEFQKTVHDLILTFSLAVLHRRSKSQNEVEQANGGEGWEASGDKRKYEIDASGFTLTTETEDDSFSSSTDNYVPMSVFQSNDNSQDEEIETLEVKCDLPFEIYEHQQNSEDNDDNEYSQEEQEEYAEDDEDVQYVDISEEYNDDDQGGQQVTTSRRYSYGGEDEAQKDKINKIIREKFQTQNPLIQIEKLNCGTDGQLTSTATQNRQPQKVLPKLIRRSTSDFSEHSASSSHGGNQNSHTDDYSSFTNLHYSTEMSYVMSSNSNMAAQVTNSNHFVARKRISASTAPQTPGLKTNKEFLYKCRYCFKGFPQIPTLRMHERTHVKTANSRHAANAGQMEDTNGSDADKQYKCPKCDKRFNSRSNMGSHMKIHIGKKSFSCDYCSYATYWLSNLKTHYRTHTGEHPYQCSQCVMQFKTYQTGVTHFKKSHPEYEFSKGCLLRNDSNE